MDHTCKSCGKKIDAALVVCPHCGNPPAEEPKREFDHEQIKQVAKQLKKEIGNTVIFWLGIISLLCGAGVWQAYRTGVEEMKVLLVQGISKEFEEPEIKKTVRDVAQNQAATLLKNEIGPEVTKFKSETGEKIDEFGDYLKELKTRYEKDLALLSSELALLKQRNEIAKLGDNAIVRADKASFHRLEILEGTDGNPDIRAAAGAQVRLIKSRWISSSTVKVGRHTIDGKQGADHKSSELIHVLVTDKNRSNRVLAAKALANHGQKGVPDALLKSICEDPDLEVVVNAMWAFEDITGFLAPDIFRCQPAEIWWKDHQEVVNAKLTDLQ